MGQRRRPARRCPDRELHLAQAQPLAVLQLPAGEVGLGRLAVTDLGTGVVGDLEVTGEKVGVEVRLDHVADAQPGGVGVGQVTGHVPLGVDDGRLPSLLVGHQVGRVGEAVEVVLREDHRPPW